MTSVEIRRAMNEFIALYPNYYRNLSQESMERIARSWQKRFESVNNYDAFVEVLYQYEAESEYPNPPSTKQWMTMYKTKVNQKELGRSVRRIETPEEVLSNMYHYEMRKPPNKRNEWLIRRCIPYARLFQDENAYIKYFGKPRKEFEKL